MCKGERKMRIDPLKKKRWNNPTQEEIVSLDSLGVPPAPPTPVTEEFWEKEEGYKQVEKAVIEANRKKYYKE